MIKKLIMFLITAGLVLQNINITAQAEETVSAELDSQTATQQNISVTMGTSSDVITKTQAGKTGWVLDTSDEVTDHAYIYAM